LKADLAPISGVELDFYLKWSFAAFDEHSRSKLIPVACPVQYLASTVTRRRIP
jgi:hypothetical protein